MAEYTNFFNSDDPLNLYKSPTTSPLFPTIQTPYDAAIETEEQKEQRLKGEKEEKQKLQEKQKQMKARFDTEVSNKYNEHLTQALQTGEGLNQDLFGQAQQEVLHSKDLETGQLRYPNLLLKSNFDDLVKAGKEYQKQEQEFPKFSGDVMNLVKDFQQFPKSQKSSLQDYKDEVLDQLVARGNYATKREAETEWNAASEEAKSVVTLGALGRKYFANDEERLNEFLSLDDTGRLSMLVSAVKSSPFYESEAAKYKDEINAAAYDVCGKFIDFFKGGQEEAEEMTKSDNYWERLSGVVGSFGNSILHGVSSLAYNLTKGVYGELTNSDEEQTDKVVNELDEYYISNKSKELKQDYLSRSPEEKKLLADFFDNLSESSATYKQAKDTDLVNILDDTASPEEVIDAKVSKLAELKTRANLYGDDAAFKDLDNFWKDTTAHNQGALDYLMNTAVVGGASLGSDMLGFAAVVGNIFNPYTYTEGYSDAMLQHNYLLNWADIVQKWGEEHGHTYKTADEEDSFISWRDVPDLVGQYGFTMGSKYTSMLGSNAARGITKYAAKKALQEGIQGAAARKLIWSKELRNTIKEGIKAGKGTEKYTKALESINQIQSQRLYNLNLAVGAGVGTAEGVIEAKQTYDQFIKDNNVDALYDDRKAQIEGANNQQLEEYMKSAGFEPASMSVTSEGVAIASYSPEQYEQARQQLLANNEGMRAKAIERREDDALDAAAANMLFNSTINGALNVLMKETLLSNDVKNASRRMKKQTKGLADKIDVVKDEKGWVARVKEGIKDKDKSIWRKIGSGALKVGKVGWEATKTAAGEALEEYGQTITDDLSRAALQADLTNYLSTVYDKESHDAFNTDMLNIINTGFGALGTSLSSKEAIKAGVFGFFSTLGGGMNPLGAITGSTNVIKNRSKAKFGSRQWFKETGKNVGDALAGLYEGAIIQAYRDSKEDGDTARKLAENVNAWLNNETNQELMTHMGGAIGFKKLLENSLMATNTDEARDNKLALAVENVFMLNALEGTQMAEAYNKEIDDHIALEELTTEQNRQQNFDEQGNFIGQTKDQEGKPNAQNLQAKSAIEAFKEWSKQAADGMSDLEIIQKISQNAKEFRELQQKVNAYSQKVQQMYHEDNLDPIVQQAYVQAMITQEKNRSRADNLRKKVNGIFEKDNPNLTDNDKELIDTKSGLERNTLNVLTQFGSVKNAEKASENLGEQINEIETSLAKIPKRANVKEGSKEEQLQQQEEKNKKTLQFHKKILEKQKEALDSQIKLAKADIIKRKEHKAQQEAQLDETIEGNSNPVGQVVDNPETLSKTSQKRGEINYDDLFTVGDLVSMTPNQRSRVLSNRKQFSQEQNEEINKFLDLSLRLQANAASQEAQEQGVPILAPGDIALTREEVVSDYVDLATLEAKESAYDTHLTRYIQDPRFLTSEAERLKNNQRKNTLRFYYKDDLRLRPEETTLDMMDRLQDKINILKEIGRNEDASILESIINEDAVLKKVHDALKETEIRVAAATQTSPELKDKTTEVNQALTSLRTIISNSGMSLKEIKALLDNNDVDSIKRELKKKYKEKYVLDTQLEKSKQTPLLASSDNIDAALDPVVQNIKDILDVYYRGVKQEQTRGKQQKVTPKPQSQRQQQKASNPAQPKPNAGTEESYITILTPGNIDRDSQDSYKQGLRAFLEVHGVSAFLSKMENPDKQGGVKFMVTNKFGKPVIFAVVPSKQTKMPNGQGFQTFHIGRKHYQIIGVIEPGKSAKLDQIAEETRKSIKDEGTNASRILQYNNKDVSFSVSKITDPTFTSDTSKDPNNPPPLNEQIGTDTELQLWVDDFVDNGKVDDKSNSEERTVTFYKDGYPVGTAKTTIEVEGHSMSKAMSIFDVPIKGLKIDGEEIQEITLGELLNSSEYLGSAIVDALVKHDSFFKTFFETWENYPDSSSSNWSETTIYQHLIGNFIYLGKSRNISGNKTDYIHPRKTDNEHLVIDSTRWDYDTNLPTATITLAIPTVNSADKKLLALHALSEIFQYVKSGDLEYHNPTINTRTIGNQKAKNVTKGEVKQEKGILLGLAQLGVLTAHTPDATNRVIELQNAFTSGAKSVRDNNPNLVTPDNSKDITPKQSMKDKVQKELTEGQKRAARIVREIQLNSTELTLPEEQNNDDSQEDTESFYEGREGRWARVTSTESAARGHNREPVKITGNAKVTSTSLGNTIDTVVRKVIGILNKSTKLYGENDAALLYEELIKCPEFHGKIPNYSKALIVPFLKELIRLYNISHDLGWTLVPEGIKTFGMLDVFSNGEKVGKLPTAGTLDILAYDENGDFFIIDVKTRHKTSQMDAWEKKTAEGWTIQINDYQYILEQQYGGIGMTFTGQNYVFAAMLDYSVPAVKTRQGDNKMSILIDSKGPLNDKEMDITKKAPEVIKKDEYYLGMLMPIESELDGNHQIGVDLNRLPQGYKDLVIPIGEKDSNEQQGTPFDFKGKPEPTDAPQAPPEVPISKSSEFKEENAAKKVDLSESFKRPGKKRGRKSARTVKQARFTDFVNNHIAPLSQAKVNVVGKVVQKVKELLGSREGQQKLMMSDLANTFFQGNINQVKSILKGLKITPANMPTIVNRLKSYFESYINNEQILIENAQKRQQVYKALYDYLQGNITENQFQEEIFRLNIESKDLPELVDYINSTDKENERRRILLKIENSGVHTEQELDAVINTIKNRVENMRTKLEFLSTQSASNMLNTRLQSVKNAIDTGNYEETQVDDEPTSMKKLLKGEDHLYGTDNLLSYIKSHSKNIFFRNLASTLQTYMRQQHIYVTVSLDDQMLNVEGEASGRNITIYRNSLSSYEQLERVLLHEIIHSVLLISPRVKDQLSSVIDKAIANIARSTGKSISEIKREYYGLTSVEEFISEFFTNYAFQEMLKTISDSESVNMADRVVDKILSIFGKQGTIYSQAYKAMQELLRENSLESLERTEETIEDIPYIRHSFKALNKGLQKVIKQKGISEEEYNNMTAFEQQHLEDCCK